MCRAHSSLAGTRLVARRVIKWNDSYSPHTSIHKAALRGPVMHCCDHSLLFRSKLPNSLLSEDIRATSTLSSVHHNQPTYLELRPNLWRVKFDCLLLHRWSPFAMTWQNIPEQKGGRRQACLRLIGPAVQVTGKQGPSWSTATRTR